MKLNEELTRIANLLIEKADAIKEMQLNIEDFTRRLDDLYNAWTELDSVKSCMEDSITELDTILINE